MSSSSSSSAMVVESRVLGGAAASDRRSKESYLDDDIAPAGQTNFRMRRSSAACETCKKLKIRCIRESPGMPCAKCTAFKTNCHVAKGSKPKAEGVKASKKRVVKKYDGGTYAERFEPSQRCKMANIVARPVVERPRPKPSTQKTRLATFLVTPPPTLGPPTPPTPKEPVSTIDDRTYLNLLAEPGIYREPVTATHKLAYLGEPCSVALLGEETSSFPEQIGYTAPVSSTSVSARLEKLDRIEVEILIRKGALMMPPKSLCDDLVDSYFQWIHPIIPIINRARFMRQYHDRDNPPSLLLLQAVILAASRVSSNPLLTDSNGSTVTASCTFYKRAKALYDANFETDRVTVVQSLILIGWHWDGVDDVVKNIYYWGRVAIIIAQDTGMHRSVEASHLSSADKKLWKRIWWTLVTRDRSIAVAFGRPVIINLDDCDVEALQESDFIDDDEDHEWYAIYTYHPDPAQVQFFLRYVELSKIMGRIQTTLYSASSIGHQNMAEVLRIDKSLTNWLRDCPDILFWPRCRQSFWASLLHLNYYTAVCMVHRFPLSAGSSETSLQETWNHPSRDIAFHAAAMITFIVEKLAEQDQLRYCPAYIVHTLFSAFVMHVYQMRSPELSIRRTAQGRLYSCLQVTKKISHVWLVGKMVHKVLEFVVDNKLFEEHFRKARDD